MEKWSMNKILTKIIDKCIEISTARILINDSLNFQLPVDIPLRSKSGLSQVHELIQKNISSGRFFFESFIVGTIFLSWTVWAYNSIWPLAYSTPADDDYVEQIFWYVFIDLLVWSYKSNIVWSLLNLKYRFINLAVTNPLVAFSRNHFFQHVSSMC